MRCGWLRFGHLLVFGIFGVAAVEWHEAIDFLSPYLVRISTPHGSGTGWLVSRSSTSDLCAIATAAHVIDHAHFWEEPIRIWHPATDQSVVLRASERSVLMNQTLDSAGVIFPLGALQLPTNALELVEKDKFTKPGVEIGWLGFPAIPRANLCFFSGRISAFVEDDRAYLVDGVAINGVSGGPAFYLRQDTVRLLGTVSAYIPNRATGESLPGVAVVRDAMHFHDIAGRFKSFDDAKSNETPPSEPATADSLELPSQIKASR